MQLLTNSLLPSAADNTTPLPDDWLSEQLFTIMTVGMAGVAGTILAAYASMLGNDILPYLLAASFMSAPGGILMAKLMMPDDPADYGKEPVVEGEIRFGDEKPANIIMAAAEGAQTGVRLAVAVGAMVLSFVALVALANGLLAGVGSWFGYPDLSFQQIVGWVFAPVMFMLNVPWSEAQAAGGLFGTKIVLNEFVAFSQLGPMKQTFSATTVAVVTFALCGFANFSSIIQFLWTSQWHSGSVHKLTPFLLGHEIVFFA